MSSFKVYGEFRKEMGQIFRTKAKIIWNNSNNLLGSIIMLNPGDSHIKDMNLWDSWLLSDSDFIDNELSIDQTMHKIAKIIQTAYGENVSGYLNIYNLFNLRNTKSEEAIKWLQLNHYKCTCAYTPLDEIETSAFVWMAWGKKDFPKLRNRRKELYNYISQKKAHLIYHDKPCEKNFYTCFHPLVLQKHCSDYLERIVYQLNSYLCRMT